MSLHAEHRCTLGVAPVPTQAMARARSSEYGAGWGQWTARPGAATLHTHPFPALSPVFIPPLLF
jgi:hypothetical protein